MKKSEFLKYNGYKIIKMDLDYDNKDDSESDGLNIFYKVKEEGKGFNEISVYQGILISPNKEFPYKLEVIIKGKFEFSKSMSFDEKKNMILTNVPAIQYPYLRALISLMSSQTDYEKILLPTMNFAEFLKKTKWEDILIKAEI